MIKIARNLETLAQTKSAFIHWPSSEEQMRAKLAPSGFNRHNAYQWGNILAGAVPGALLGGVAGLPLGGPIGAGLGAGAGGLLGILAGGALPELMAKPEDPDRFGSITKDEQSLADQVADMKKRRDFKARMLGLGVGAIPSLALGNPAPGFAGMALAGAIANSTNVGDYDNLIKGNRNYKSLLKKINGGEAID